MAAGRHHHLANDEDIDTSSRLPQNDPQRHTHVQHSCDPVQSDVVKGPGPTHVTTFVAYSGQEEAEQLESLRG